MSCHNGAVHNNGGVRRWMRMGMGCEAIGVCCIRPGIGSSRLMFCIITTVGVAGTTLMGVEVRLAWLGYISQSM